MADSVQAKISFIVPVRNDAHRLKRCLASIARASAGHDTEVVVVDNGSHDQSRQVAAMHGRVLDVAGGPVARLRNEGVESATGDLLAFVDADHEIAESWVSAALIRLADVSIAAVGAPYHPPANGTWVQRTYDRLRSHSTAVADTQWLGSGNLVVRREAFMAVAGFDTRLNACEDVDLCARLRQEGFRLVEDPSLYTEHLGDPETLGALFKSELWRGRNNLAVTLTSERTLRSMISLAIPVVTLAALVTAAIGTLLFAWPAVTLALAVIFGLAALRAIAMLRRGRPAMQTAAECLAVATVYNVARSLALVWSAQHRRARAPATMAVKSAR